MFTISVVIGSSILYKDFNSATPERLLKFIFGCISTFIGVYLITSKRHTRHIPKPRRSAQHLRLPSSESETAPLAGVESGTTTSTENSEEIGETPPHLIGTSFGYHFANPKILERKGSRATLPRRERNSKPRDDLVSAMWPTWRLSDGELMNSPEERMETTATSMGRTQSDRSPVVHKVHGHRDGEDTQSDVGEEGRGSLGRNRGYSVI
jgi:hypothetical protein